ncbi:MAG: hypothetical protein IIB74_04570 [Proteobacteria bacterium]|nr:hypothetical protein [Pseudomonadota bacterium]
MTTGLTPGLTYYYNYRAANGSGSAWGARKMAWLMGCDQVILCGCPLAPGPYVGNHNLGGFMADENVVEDLRAGIEAEPEWFDGAFSMSGWTETILGAPDEKRKHRD